MSDEMLREIIAELMQAPIVIVAVALGCLLCKCQRNKEK